MYGEMHQRSVPRSLIDELECKGAPAAGGDHELPHHPAVLVLEVVAVEHERERWRGGVRKLHQQL
jgi:hypothetical protein